jgi:hypothetical protein
MSRSGYIDDYDDDLAIGRWRGAVKSAIEGRRGQSFLRDLLVALEALPEKKLIAGNMERKVMQSISSWGLIEVDCVCAIGAVGKARGVDMSGIDRLIEEFQDDYGGNVSDEVAGAFNISNALAREIMFMNDEAGRWDETLEQRYKRVVCWVKAHLNISKGSGLNYADAK